jgi:Putative metallopeptidase
MITPLLNPRPLILVAALMLAAYSLAQTPATVVAKCSIDLHKPGQMKDIVSNVLLQSAMRPEPKVQEFLKGAEKNYETGDALMRAAAKHFMIDETKMAAEVLRFKHVNCTHGPISGDPGTIFASASSSDTEEQTNPIELSDFARDVTLHVVLHELAHALIREFNLPILGNEETMADAFATHYLTTYLPDRAVAVLNARVASWIIESREVPREQWPVSGEHDNDARRAFQVAALAVAADPVKYASVAKQVGMEEDDIEDATDYGAEIHRSWRRTLAPLFMPNTERSNQARVVCDDHVFAKDSAASLIAELDSHLTRFDWHSQVTIRFAASDGGAGWSRSKRTITVNSEYIRRFLKQGKAADLQAP